jgi:GDP/UDP-N,N'-diacetylbacillosamine 2-epimerase (hydrolysing)
VIDCVPDKKSITNAFEKLYSAEFQELLKTVQNPYGAGCASEKIINEIKKVDPSSFLKKSFYDLKGKK